MSWLRNLAASQWVRVTGRPASWAVAAWLRGPTAHMQWSLMYCGRYFQTHSQCKERRERWTHSIHTYQPNHNSRKYYDVTSYFSVIWALSLFIFHWKRHVPLHLEVFLVISWNWTLLELCNYYFYNKVWLLLQKHSNSELKRNQKSSKMQQASLWQRRPQNHVG